MAPRPGRILLLSTLAVLVLLGAIGLAGCSGSTAQLSWGLRTVSSDGRVLDLVALRGACGGRAHVETHEDGSSVTVNVSQHTTGGSCVSVAVRQDVTVRLAAPLGRRTLLGCDPIPGATARDCSDRSPF